MLFAEDMDTEYAYRYYQQKTLDYVNAIRTEWDLPTLSSLPKGTRSQARECVIANALKDIPGLRYAAVSNHVNLSTIDGRSRGIELTSDAKRFIALFDHGHYPCLDLVS